MFLIRLVYASSASSSFSENDIESILETSRINNQKADITGILAFNQNYFLQCLEGSRTAVNDTYHRILNDSRHHTPRLLSYEQIDFRLFNRWSMAYVPTSSLTAEINLSYSQSSMFEPYLLHADSSVMLLEELASTVPTT